MTARVETVLMTPKHAERLLELNVNNRNLRETHVAYLTGVIRRGEWKTTPDAIMVSDTGVLINGQHRLQAIARSNVPVRVVLMAPSAVMERFRIVPTTVPDSVRTVTDCGIGRTAADLTGRDQKLCELVKGWIREKGAGSVRVSAAQIEECYLQNREMFDWATALRPRLRGVGRVYLWVALCEAYLKYPKEADAFAKALIQPASDVQQAAFLREYIIKASALTGGGDGDVVRKSYYLSTVYAFKCYLAGKRMKRVYTKEEWDT